MFSLKLANSVEPRCRYQTKSVGQALLQAAATTNLSDRPPLKTLWLTYSKLLEMLVSRHTCSTSEQEESELLSSLEGSESQAGGWMGKTSGKAGGLPCWSSSVELSLLIFCFFNPMTKQPTKKAATELAKALAGGKLEQRYASTWLRYVFNQTSKST